MASRFLVPMGRGGGDPLLSIYREMNRMFDDVLGAGGSNAAPSGRSGNLMAMPSLDVHEEGNALSIAAELPGVDPAEVDVRLEGDVLTISGEKKSQHDQKQANYHVMERSYGRFSRSLQLPFRPNPDQVNARYDNGVLTIRLERNTQEQGSRRIQVQTSGGAGQRGLSASGSQAGGSQAASMQTGGMQTGGMQTGSTQGGSGQGAVIQGPIEETAESSERSSQGSTSGSAAGASPNEVPGGAAWVMGKDEDGGSSSGTASPGGAGDRERATSTEAIADAAGAT
jgi:HSP20 family protein